MSLEREWTAIVLLVLSAAACGRSAAPVVATEVQQPAAAGSAAIVLGTDSHADPSIDSLDRIRDATAWRRLAAVSDEHAIARTEVVKIVHDLRTDQLHFCQSERWPLHYEFAVRFFETPGRRMGERRAFMTRNYLRDDRDLIMATIVRFLDSDVWALELGPADTLSGERIVGLLERVRERTHFGDRLRFHPRSDRHTANIAAVRDRISVVESDELWRGIRYQPVTLGEAYGRVHIVRGTSDLDTARVDDILVVEQTPDDLPLVAALVASELETPLAHVAVLSASRGIPNMALRGAFRDERITSLAGRWARLRVEARGFSLAETQERPGVHPRAGPAIMRPDGNAHDLSPLAALDIGDIAQVGAKAAQLGEVARRGFPTAGGFVIPVGHYLAHLRTTGIDVTASSLRAQPGFGRERASRAAVLQTLRDRIEAAPVAPALLDQLATRAGALGASRVILRSSTNAEDLPGWSGAGLYDSITADAHDRYALADALKRVWASTYSLRAFDERELYNIEHDQVAMAVLVQMFLDDAVAFGVAITENPYSSHRAGSFVNVQRRDGSVTATTADLPEQWLLYAQSRPEIISRSTRTGGQPILTELETVRLSDLLTRVHDAFVPLWQDRATAADVELALDARRQFVILQVRPTRGSIVRRTPSSPPQGDRVPQTR